MRDVRHMREIKRERGPRWRACCSWPVRDLHQRFTQALARSLRSISSASCLKLCMLSLSIWGDSCKHLRPDESSHHTDCISPELCGARFDPAALLHMFYSVALQMLILWFDPSILMLASFEFWSSFATRSNWLIFWVGDQADALTSLQSLITQSLPGEDSSISKCIKFKTQSGRLMN